MYLCMIGYIWMYIHLTVYAGLYGNLIFVFPRGFIIQWQNIFCNGFDRHSKLSLSVRKEFFSLSFFPFPSSVIEAACHLKHIPKRIPSRYVYSLWQYMSPLLQSPNQHLFSPIIPPFICVETCLIGRGIRSNLNCPWRKSTSVCSLQDAMIAPYVTDIYLSQAPTGRPQAGCFFL